MATIKFLKGESKDLPSSIHEGYMYFCTDTGKVMVDIDSETRIQLSSEKVIEDGKAEAVGNFVDKKIANSATRSYKHTLSLDGWTQKSDHWEQKYENSEIRCGITGEVSPLISYTSNQEEYSLITEAEAEPGQGITFYIKDKPKEDIGLIIIDQM